MDAQLKGTFYYFLTNMKRPFLIFWAILVGFMLITYGMSYLFADTATVIAYDLSFPIYIFGAILGFHTVKSCIPYLIKMGSTRANIFVVSGASLFALACLNAMIANTIYVIVEKVHSEVKSAIFTLETGENSYTFSHLADLVMDSTWYSRVVIDASIGFFLLAAFFLLALIFYRYGFIGGFGTLGIFMGTIAFGIERGWLIDFFSSIFSNFHFTFFYQLMLTGIVIYLLSYVLMRRLTI